MSKMSGVCMAFAAFAAAPGAVAAQSGGGAVRLAPAIGAVIVSTHPDGRKAKLWLQSGGSYTAQSRAGGRSGGTWKVNGDKLCLSQRSPFPIPIAYCKTIPAETVGRPWRDTAVNGDPVTNEIISGGTAVAKGKAD